MIKVEAHGNYSRVDQVGVSLADDVEWSAMHLVVDGVTYYRTIL